MQSWNTAARRNKSFRGRRGSATTPYIDKFEPAAAGKSQRRSTRSFIEERKRPMIIYPAIDIMDGQCVRLVHGEKSQRTNYSNNPADVALKWRSLGARWLHVIDLDAAINQKPLANIFTIKKILTALGPGTMSVQVGGGIRERSHIETLLDLGVTRVIVGTKVIESENFAREIFNEFQERVVLALDSRDGKVAVKGWTDISDMPTEEFAKKMDRLGARTMNVTDITRDGTLTEPNFEMIERLCKLVRADIVASGGVSALEHIEKLKKLKRKNMNGAIVGKALYEGKFDLKKAIEKYQDKETP